MFQQMRCWLLAAMLLFSLTGYAALDLELTKGLDTAVPVAIVGFDSATMVAGHVTFAQVIRNDLNNSGQFRVGPLVNRASNFDWAHFDWTSWRQKKVNAVIRGELESKAFGRYEVHVQLFNPYADQAAQCLFDKRFQVNKKQLRALAHHISDLVYEQLTGIRGIFSTHLAYVLITDHQTRREYNLKVSDADGFNPRLLLRSDQPIMSPVWAPDGHSLYYVSFEAARARIFKQVIDTGKRQVISEFSGVNNAPAISPDGQSMVLVLSKTGYLKLYQMNLATSVITPLTSGRSIDTEPAFTPDGKHVLFTSDRGGSPQIYQLNLKDHHVSRLTFNGNYNARARVLPDGKGFVMMHRRSGMFGIAKQLFSSNQLTLLAPLGRDESPSIAPNGQMVVYASNRGGRGILAMMSVDGGVQLNLPSRQGSVQEPAWSPFG